MQVPPDLATRLASAAQSSGRSPEAFLREAVSQLIESMGNRHATLREPDPQSDFVPQPQRFSIYE